MSPARCHVVTPIYNDVDSFLILHDRVLSAIRSSSIGNNEVRFLVIDDTAGQDPDIEKLCGLNDVSVVEPPFNLGHQRAIVVALRAAADRFADDDFILTMDGDGEDKPEDIPRLLEPLLDPVSPPLVVLARRTKRKESFAFKLFYLSFRVLFRVLTGREVRSGNFAAFRGSYARRMLLHPSFDLCYSSSLLTVTQEPAFVACARGDRYAGHSRMGPERLLTHGVRMLMPFADRIAIRSLALCASTALLTVVLLVLLLVGRLVGWSVSPVWGWILAGSMVLAGLGLVNFLVLFSGFVQTNALSLARIAERVSIDGRTA